MSGHSGPTTAPQSGANDSVICDRFRFSTAGLTTRAAFDAYRRLYALGADPNLEDEDFSAEMTSHRFDRLTVHDRRVRSIRHRRDPTRVRRDDFSHFTLTLCLAGCIHGDDGNGFRAIRPGEIMLLDMSRPMATRLSDAHLLTVGVGREIVEASGDAGAPAHGTIIPRSSGLGLARYLTGLTRPRADLTTPPADAIAALLGDALGADGDRSPAGQRARRMGAAHRIIEAELDDPELDAARVAARLGISRATLYRLFAPIGGIGRHIVERRLIRLHHRLASSGPRTSVAMLMNETGFVSESHASRAFLSQFGYRPGHVRRMTASMSDAEHAILCMQLWSRDLR